MMTGRLTICSLYDVTGGQRGAGQTAGVGDRTDRLFFLTFSEGLNVFKCFV